MINHQMINRTFILSLILLCYPAPVVFSAADFVGAPTAVSEGPNVRIDFTVSEATDVTVGIIDSGDTLVRHLVSGKLGSTAPSPFTPGSLTQSILWDRTDDAGLAVGAGTVNEDVWVC